MSNMNYKKIMIAACWIGISAIASAEQNDLQELTDSTSTHEWQSVRKDQVHNIMTYSKLEDDKPLRSFRAEAFYNNSFDAVARHQLDTANMKNWFMNMDESRLLKKVSDTEFYYYFRLRAPMGVPPRDAIIHAKIEPYNASRGSLVIRYNAVPEFEPRKEGIIRMLAFEVVTRITPLSANKVKEETEGYANPGGIVPKWLINYLQRQMPYNNMLARARDIPNYERQTGSFEFKYKE